jgi:hypothetical protein
MKTLKGIGWRFYFLFFIGILMFAFGIDDLFHRRFSSGLLMFFMMGIEFWAAYDEFDSWCWKKKLKKKQDERNAKRIHGCF